jgi:hypothetical protein
LGQDEGDSAEETGSVEALLERYRSVMKEKGSNIPHKLDETRNTQDALDEVCQGNLLNRTLNVEAELAHASRGNLQAIRFHGLWAFCRMYIVLRYIDSCDCSGLT